MKLKWQAIPEYSFISLNVITLMISEDSRGGELESENISSPLMILTIAILARFGCSKENLL